MTAIQSMQWQWEFQAKAPVLGLHQSDLSCEVTFFDQEGGVYVLNETGKLILELGFKQAVKAARVVEEGNKVIILDATGTLHVYDLKGKCLWQIRFDPNATCMDARAEGQAIAVAAGNGLISFYNGQGKKLRSVYLSHSVCYLKFAFDRGDLVVGNAMGQITYLNNRLEPLWQMDVGTHCAGIDVNHDASLFLLTAYAEGVYAFNRNQEAIGAYEIGSVVSSSALCQKGERILACNREGRLHVIRRDGSLEFFFDTNEDIAQMDLNYQGDVAALQVGEKSIRYLRFLDYVEKPAISSFFDVTVESGDPSKQRQLPQNDHILWKKSYELSVGSLDGAANMARVFYTANGAFSVCLSEDPCLFVLDHDGQLLWQERLAPVGSYLLSVSHAGNSILLRSSEYVDYFTCNQGRIERLRVAATHASVHPGGLSFALLTVDQKLRFFDKSGKSVWTKPMDAAVADLQVTPSGNAVFVATTTDQLRAIGADGNLRWEKTIPDLTPYSRLGLNKDGITIGSEAGKIFRMDTQGKLLWEKQVDSGLQEMNVLRNYVFLRLENGKLIALNRAGQIVAERDGVTGLSQMAVDNAGRLLFVKCEEDFLHCENCSEKKMLWRHQAPAPITCFDIETCGGKLLYWAADEIRSLALMVESTAAPSVTFLEL